MLIAPSSSGSAPTALPMLASNMLFLGRRKRHRKKSPEVQHPITKPVTRQKPAPIVRPDSTVWGKVKNIFLLYLMAFAGIQEAMAQPGSSDLRFSFNTPNAIPGKFTDWAHHIDVLASASQRHFSMFDRFKATGFYTQALTDTLCRDEVSSLGEAHCLLQEKGYPTNDDSKLQKPVSTYEVDTERDCISMWDKMAPPNTKRFALLLVNGKEVRANLRLMQNTLKNVYKLPDSQILSVKNGSTQDFRRGLRNLLREVDKAKLSGQEAEVLVYYSGHGTTHERNAKLLAFSEGQAEGRVQTSNGLMDEDKFRSLVHNYLPGVNTLIVLDSCHSGSWIG